jgi:hypothetical protein
METANDAEWLRASERVSALSGLFTRRSPAAVEEVARDLKLSPAMVYRLLADCRKNPSPGCARPWISTGKGIFLQVKD